MYHKLIEKMQDQISHELKTYENKQLSAQAVEVMHDMLKCILCAYECMELDAKNRPATMPTSRPQHAMNNMNNMDATTNASAY